MASGLRLSNLSVRDKVSPTRIGPNSAFDSQTLKYIYDALVLFRVSRKFSYGRIGPASPCHVEANGQEVERRKESTVVLVCSTQGPCCSNVWRILAAL